MAEKRMLHKSISHSTTMADLESHLHRLIATWCIAHADVSGALTADPRRLRAIVVPLLEDVTTAMCAAAIEDMVRVGLVVRCATDCGEPGMRFAKWSARQELRENREASTRYVVTPGALPEHSRKTPAQVRLGEGRSGEERSDARAPEERAPSEELDERRRAILETLALHPTVWLPAQHQALADSLMSGQLAAPKPVDHIRSSIHEAAAKIMATEAGGEHFPPARRATFLVGCVASLAKQSNGKGSLSPEAAEAERLAANERARGAKAAQERKARPAEPTPEERRANAANAKAARLALARVGSGPAPAASTAPALPPIRGSDEVEDAAVERGRADRARLDAWAATAEVRP